MKILLATSMAIPSGGGIASYNQELVRLLSHKNSIYLLTDANEVEVEGYEKTYRTYGHSNNDYDYCAKLVTKINEDEYDCIINSNSQFIPVLAPFLKPAIISVSHFVNGKLALNAGYNADNIDAIIALSEYGKKFLIDRFRIKKTEKIKVIYNFVETSKSPKLDKVSHKPLRIVYPGGTSIEKSVDVIQKLIYRLIDSDLDFEFYWLGGTKLPSANLSIFGLHETYDLFKSDPRLTITGKLSREKAIEIIESANIFLLPSRGEGCPMTLLEAMRGGCIPVISDSKHGSRELVEASGVGFITKQGSSSDIFDKLSYIITNHNKYIDQYTQSFRFLTDNLSHVIWADKMEKVMSEVMSHPSMYVPITKNAFFKSANGYSRLTKLERIKTMVKSLLYRAKIDISFLSSKI
jgi:glycosyltransferase involved in cell wall biosynthesis